MQDLGQLRSEKTSCGWLDVKETQRIGSFCFTFESPCPICKMMANSDIKLGK